MKRLIMNSLVFSLLYFSSFAQIGNITEVKVGQRDDGSGMVDINFVLMGLASSFYDIELEVSFDNGKTFQPISPEYLSGPLRLVKPSDTQLHVKWDGLSSFPETYSEQAQLKFIATLTTGGTLTDIDGNVYRTVVIGNQEWMAENLRVTRNPAGDNINRVCYDNDPENCLIYGGLYTWNTAMNGSQSSLTNPSNVQGICPAGWHMPSMAEWGTLLSFLYQELDILSAGNALKSCRQVASPLGGDCDTPEHPRWNQNDNHFGTDLLDFSALPAGYMNSIGSFSAKGTASFLLTSTEVNSLDIVYYRISVGSGNLSNTPYLSKNWSFSVRCVKDME